MRIKFVVGIFSLFERLSENFQRRPAFLWRFHWFGLKYHNEQRWLEIVVEFLILVNFYSKFLILLKFSRILNNISPVVVRWLNVFVEFYNLHFQFWKTLACCEVEKQKVIWYFLGRSYCVKIQNLVQCILKYVSWFGIFRYIFTTWFGIFWYILPGSVYHIYFYWFGNSDTFFWSQYMKLGQSLARLIHLNPLQLHY